MNFNKTKIVATVGPACNTREKLLELIVAGVDVFRLNFSHGTHDQHLEVIKHIRNLNQEFNFNIAILQDLQGPKIRLRDLENGGIEVKAGEMVVIAYEEGIGTRERLTSTYDLAQDVRAGEQILIDDGNIELRAIKIVGREVHAEVVYGGLLKPRKGINLPDTIVSAASLTKKDREDLIFGLENEVDWVAMSFVRTAVDILELRKLINESGKHSRIVAKIETPFAIKNIDEIIAATDGLMVARGDLGVEIPMEEVPLIQKTLVQKCNAASKPVIIATQMMESMIKNPRPTRAETNDVANAVIDGADALMLSAETASGTYPIQTVQSMVKTIGHIERYQKSIYNKKYMLDEKSPNYVSNALIAQACKLARNTHAKAIIGMSRTGYTAFEIAKYRPESNIFVFTRTRKLLCTLNLVWGVRGFVYDRIVSAEETFTDIEKILVDTGYLQKGEVYVSTRGSVPGSDERSGINILKISKVER